MAGDQLPLKLTVIGQPSPQRPMNPHSRLHFSATLLMAGLTMLLGLTPTAAETQPLSTAPPAGLRDKTPTVHALTNARIVIAPGRIVEQGTIVIRDGVISEASAEAKIPAEARVWDLTGRTIYPGFIDAYCESASEFAATKGAPHWNKRITPQRNIADEYSPDEQLNSKLRSQGITARLVAPSAGIIRGTSALVLTNGQESGESLLKPKSAMHMALTVPVNYQAEQYPSSPMGAVALARQTVHDASWYARAWQALETDRTLPALERNDALQALGEWLTSKQLIMISTLDEQYFSRADEFAREFGIEAVFVGSGREYQRLDVIKATGRPVVLPLVLPTAPRVTDPDAAAQIPLEVLMHWDHAPENPARLHAAGVAIAFSSHGLKDVGTFISQVRKVVSRGLPKDAALAALTTTPAALLRAQDIGSLEPGKLAQFVVTDGDIFEEQTSILETWVRGKRFVTTQRQSVDLRGTWQLTVKNPVRPDDEKLTLTLTGPPGKLGGTLRPVVEIKPAAAPVEARELAGATDDGAGKLEQAVQLDSSISALVKGAALKRDGVIRLTTTAITNGDGTDSLDGKLVWPDGTVSAFHGVMVQKGAPPSAGETDDTARKPLPGYDPKAAFPVNYPLGAFGRTTAPTRPRHVLFQNATLWTCGPKGIIERGSLLVTDGRIADIGPSVAVPDGAVVVDCADRHLAPGIVDCHAHLATDGGINEMAQSITSEVRIGDFIDAHDINLYRQLAGGVTCANVLHGSANPIGGQNQVIKFRWGGTYDELKLAGSPPGIKFALGENVKQSNLVNIKAPRYPQTRMGVEQIFRDAFQTAVEYRLAWRQWNDTGRGMPPRRDLELDALVEILDGKRWIHCHSYRQDEIVAFLSVMKEFGIQVGTLQHVLEGYKVADLMQQHGTMGSTFADWWAYKFEVYDAIPYNAALMQNAGVVVSFNSDSPELARHLNHEAAKAMKYGGLAPADALKLVTINPARQLRIQDRVGSLEVGKDADIVVWSGSPLSVLSRCEQTWIDGRKYFDRTEDLALRQEATRMRQVLEQKILASGEPMVEFSEKDVSPSTLWPREDAGCRCGMMGQWMHGR